MIRNCTDMQLFFYFVIQFDDKCSIIYTVLYTVHNAKYYTFAKEDVYKAYISQNELSD